MLSEFESKIFGWMSDYIKNYRLSKTLDKKLYSTVLPHQRLNNVDNSPHANF